MPGGYDLPRRSGGGSTGGGGGVVPTPSPSFLLGDGSDGPITVDSDTFTWPDPTGVADWQAATGYVIGDRVRSTGTHGGRVYVCISAGTSGAADPFDATENPPGGCRRGDRFAEVAANGITITWWELETAIFEGWVEGPVCATTFAIAAGHTLWTAGWPILATTSVTIPATATLNAAGLDETSSVHDPSRDYRSPASGSATAPATLMGVGVLGTDANGTYGGGSGIVWGGGSAGSGGSGADGPGGGGGGSQSLGFQGYSFARVSPLTMFNMWAIISVESGPYAMGNSGGPGTSDTPNGKFGGAGAGAGSPVAVFTKTLSLDGLIDCSGGDGAPGEVGGDTGGGGGGSGGCCVLGYTTRVGSGTIDVSGGHGGPGQGAGTAGGDGSSGDLVELNT